MTDKHKFAYNFAFFKFERDEKDFEKITSEYAVLEKIVQLEIRPNSWYEILPTSKFNRANRVTVIKPTKEGALCVLHKMDGRSPWKPMKTLEGEHLIPYRHFVCEI